MAALCTAQWVPDSTTLYAAGESEGEIHVFELQVLDGNVQELTAFPVDNAAVFALTPESQSLAISDAGGHVQILNLDSGAVLAEFQSVAQPVDLG